MGYADYDDPAPPPRPSQPAELLDHATGAIGLVVRLIGLALLCVGVAVGLKVIDVAYTLYRQPQNIERFAHAIEQGSHLDEVLSPEPSVGASSGSDAADAGTAMPAPTQAHARRMQGIQFRLSYFAAWIIMLLLMLVASGIAMSVVSAGGRLALGERRVKG